MTERMTLLLILSMLGIYFTYVDATLKIRVEVFAGWDTVHLIGVVPDWIGFVAGSPVVGLY